MKNKQVNHHPERLSLSEASFTRVNGWITSLTPTLRGAKVSRSDLVNWLISKQTDELSQGAAAELQELYFDPVKAMAWASQEIQRRQKEDPAFDSKEFISCMLGTTKKHNRMAQPRSSKPQPKQTKTVTLGVTDGEVES